MADEFEIVDESPAKELPPLSDGHRYVLQNFYDTQPKLRKQYLKELGYEMSDSDKNLYKPIGGSDWC